MSSDVFHRKECLLYGKGPEADVITSLGHGLRYWSSQTIYLCARHVSARIYSAAVLRPDACTRKTVMRFPGQSCSLPLRIDIARLGKWSRGLRGCKRPAPQQLRALVSGSAGIIAAASFGLSPEAQSPSRSHPSLSYGTLVETAHSPCVRCFNNPYTAVVRTALIRQPILTWIRLSEHDAVLQRASRTAPRTWRESGTLLPLEAKHRCHYWHPHCCLRCPGSGSKEASLIQGACRFFRAT